jgi:outer membrane protein, multidrug efflux system
VALTAAGKRYREGYASYLDELFAQRNLFAVQRSELQLRAELLATEIGAYKALGGGWSIDTDGATPPGEPAGHTSAPGAAPSRL